MSAQLQVGDRVYAVVDGVPDRDDLGVVAALESTPSGREVAIIAWDSGDVDQVTPYGNPDETCGAIGATPTGERWDEEATASALARCLAEDAP